MKILLARGRNDLMTLAHLHTMRASQTMGWLESIEGGGAGTGPDIERRGVKIGAEADPGILGGGGGSNHLFGAICMKIF